MDDHRQVSGSDPAPVTSGSGDRATRFASLYRTDRDRLVRLAYLISGDLDLAEEAVADAVVRTWRAHRHRTIDDPGRYLTRAVVNACTDRFRRAAIRRRAASLRSGDDRGIAWIEEQATDGVVVRAALQSLPVDQRAVVVLRYYEGRSEQEIAALLGIPAGTVKSRLARALARLRQLVADGDRTGERPEGVGT
jgi:RNA polymerase sigma factor (sigma-70 family)